MLHGRTLPRHGQTHPGDEDPGWKSLWSDTQSYPWSQPQTDSASTESHKRRRRVRDSIMNNTDVHMSVHTIQRIAFVYLCSTIKNSSSIRKMDSEGKKECWERLEERRNSLFLQRPHQERAEEDEGDKVAVGKVSTTASLVVRGHGHGCHGGVWLTLLSPQTR